MKIACVALQFIGAVLGMARAASATEYYSSKYDHVDVDVILNNRRLVNHYAACLLSKGPCPTDGQEFKRIVPEALETNCLRCTEKRKTVMVRAIKRLQKEYPKIWAQLEEVWDPDGIYVNKFLSTHTRETDVKASAHVPLFNRFGGEDDENSISQVYTATIPPTKLTTIKQSPTSTTTTTSAVSTTTAITSPTTSKPSSTTNKPNTSTTRAPTRQRPAPNIEAGIQATVTMVKSIEQIVGQIAKEKLEFFNRLLKG